MMKRLILTLLLAVICSAVFAQKKTTVAFATKDSCTLYMDIYTPEQIDTAKPCILFMFGGGFSQGNRFSHLEQWSKTLTDGGYTFVSIDYRLGLKGVKNAGINSSFIKSLKNAINIAVEDLFSATNFLIEHGAEYGVNANKLIITGSSAGALTVLQGEYEICNSSSLASVLPQGYNYAGVMAFAGAIFDPCHGSLRFPNQPCPIMMLYGTGDQIVPYGRISLFGMCFGGSSEIARVLKKNNIPHTIYRYEERGHDVCMYMDYAWPREVDFINNCVLKKSGNSADATLNEKAAPEASWGRASLKSIYK